MVQDDGIRCWYNAQTNKLKKPDVNLKKYYKKLFYSETNNPKQCQGSKEILLSSMLRVEWKKSLQKPKLVHHDDDNYPLLWTFRIARIGN